MAIVIRLLDQSEIGLANDFFNAVYKTDRPMTHFQWEFMDSPWGKAIYVVAIDSAEPSYTKIVGIQCAIPIELADKNGKQMLTAKSEDTLVDPSYRGQKIFERMYDLLFQECRNAGIHFIWGFTPAKKAFERIGFEIPFMAHQALMVFKPAYAYSYLSRLNPQNKAIDKFKILGLSLLSMVRAVKYKTLSGGGLTVKTIPPGSKTEVLKKLTDDSPLHFLNMNDKYVSWRMTQNPFNNSYENYQFFSGDALVADVIVNFRQVGYLEQIIFSSTISRELKIAVLLQVIRIMKKKVGLIRALTFDINEELQSQEDLLKECGFTIIKRGGYFVWKPLSDLKIKAHSLFVTRLFTQGNQ